MENHCCMRCNRNARDGQSWGHANPQLSQDIQKTDLSQHEKADLVAFMKACTGALPIVEQGRLPP